MLRIVEKSVIGDYSWPGKETLSLTRIYLLNVTSEMNTDCLLGHFYSFMYLELTINSFPNNEKLLPFPEGISDSQLSLS